jgi:hypothetical protein
MHAHVCIWLAGSDPFLAEPLPPSLVTSNVRNDSSTIVLLLAQDAAAARASDTAAGLLGRSPAAPHGNIQVGSARVRVCI